MPVAWDQICTALGTEPILDVLVPGYVTRDELGPSFRPVPYSAYLRLEAGYLRMDAVGQFDQLQMRLVEEVAFGDISVDEDDEPMVGSLSYLFLTGEPGDQQCTGLRSWTDARSDLAAAKVKCLELEVSGRDVIFFDPTWYFGIRIGSADHSRQWRADYFVPHDMQEHSWRP